MKKTFILVFHEVYNIEWFEKVIVFLKSKFILVDITFFEKLKTFTDAKGYCHITFDDGDKTFYTNAFPILKKHKVPATLFVSPKSAINHENFWYQEIRGYDINIMSVIISKELSIPINKINGVYYIDVLKNLPLDRIHNIIKNYQTVTNTNAKPFMNMNVDELLEVKESGLITLGAHTLNHPILTNETNDNCEKEITGSIIGLQKLIGHDVKYFAYPNGVPGFDFGEREMNYLSKNNVSIAVSTAPNYISNSENKLSLPRIGLTHGSITFIKAKLILGSNWDKLRSIIRRSPQKNRQRLAKLIKKN